MKRGLRSFTCNGAPAAKIEFYRVSLRKNCLKNIIKKKLELYQISIVPRIEVVESEEPIIGIIFRIIRERR